MTPNDIERLEEFAFSMVVQALTDYREQAVAIFREETDQPQDIAEDVTREAIEAMGFSGRQERLYGKVDFKRVVYVFTPEAQAVALMVDAKAEKADGYRAATIQMSQTSMRVKMKRAGLATDEAGKLDQDIQRDGRTFHVVTVVVKFVYGESGGGYALDRIIAACIPNGKLQSKYNPNADDTIWLAGRNAPTLGEDFRVRLDFRRLKAKADWRVREIDLP